MKSYHIWLKKTRQKLMWGFPRWAKTLFMSVSPVQWESRSWQWRRDARNICVARISGLINNKNETFLRFCLTFICFHYEMSKWTFWRKVKELNIKDLTKILQMHHYYKLIYLFRLTLTYSDRRIGYIFCLKLCTTIPSQQHIHTTRHR